MTYLSLTDFQTFFCNGFVVGHRKIMFFSAHYRPPNTLFHFLVSPFLLSLLLRQLKLGQTRFFCTEPFFSRKNIRSTLEGVGVCLKNKIRNFSQEINIPQNWFLEILKLTQHEFDNEKFLPRRTEGLQVEFHKNFNFAH